MAIIPFTLNARTLELDLKRKTLAIRDGDARIELPRAEAAQMLSFLLAHPAFFEDQTAQEDAPLRPIPIVPSMASLLEDGLISDASHRLLMGVQASTGEPYWSTWQDFRSGVVGGCGRSGVTNTLAFLIAQAIVGNVEVWIVDPHFNRSSSLTAFLRPLAHRVRLAGTTDEIAHLFEDWSSEMERRKIEPGPFKPLLVVFESWSSILEQFGVEGEKIGDVEFYRLSGKLRGMVKSRKE